MTKKFKVHFLPNDVTVELEPGRTLFEAAHKAKIYINSVCGGEGTCGKCKVILKKGQIDAKPTALLRRDEIEKDYIIACQTNVQGDVQIFIPEETRLERSKILVGEEGLDLGLLTHTEADSSRFLVDPLVKKVFLELQAPTMDDNIADHERLYTEINKKTNTNTDRMQTGYRILKQLPVVLRESDWNVTATLALRGSTTEVVEIQRGDTSRNNCGVAIDVGTTTVVAHLIDLATYSVLDSEATYNSQIEYGEDYIQRIMYGEQNNAFGEIHNTIINDINNLISSLVKRNYISLPDITAVVCAGNTAMMHFLLELDPTRIRREPYIPSANFIPPIRASEVGIKINARGLLYTLPSVGAYVGADITAGAMALRLDQADDISLFIDVGTNGEVVLGNKEWMVCCSASAGPSFEGSGVQNGMRAAKGAIEKIKITKDFNVEYKTIGNVPPRGICGSGLLDCIASLLRSGVINKSGNFNAGLQTDRLRKTEDGYEFVLVNKVDAGIDADIVITQADITHLIRSKAAIYAAISTLLDSMSMGVDTIKHVYLAGGFGNYLDAKSAITIGMLPDMPVSNVKFVGNTCIAGAKLSLLSKEAFLTAQQIASKMTYFDLMSNTKFMDKFMSANFLPHTNLDEFPSVYEELAAHSSL
jgi:uncharacterized 2Fe-2S/4Fe-4S cluster protein (DUF4445 family)